jgi:hypothetical protein
MEAISPMNKIEIELMLKENWQQAKSVNCFWWEDHCKCDICHNQIMGRHMIDGKLRNSFISGLMCAYAITLTEMVLVKGRASFTHI